MTPKVENEPSKAGGTISLLWRRVSRGVWRTVLFTRGHVDLDPRRDLNRAQRLLARNLRVVFQVMRIEIYQRVELHAQALTMKTLLALVPAIVVIVALSTRFGAGLENLNREAIGWLIEVLSGSEQLQETLKTYLDSENFARASLGPGTVIILLLTVMSLLGHVEMSFNTLFHVPRRRPVGVRLLSYWALLTLGPLFLGASLAFTVSSQSGIIAPLLLELGGLGSFLLQLVPWAATWVGFSLFYIAIPNTRVRPGAALMAALVAGSLWNAGKFAFAYYAANNVTVRDIYGSLATLPLFILWVYVSWVIILAGAQLCFALQNAATYTHEKDSGRFSPRSIERAVCRLLLELGRDFHTGRPPALAEELGARLALPRALMEEALSILDTGGFVRGAAQGGYVPARDLGGVTVADVLDFANFKVGTDTAPRADWGRQVVDHIFADLDAQRDRVIGQMDFRALIRASEGTRAAPATVAADEEQG